jgi:uncharacterized membrane protein
MEPLLVQGRVHLSSDATEPGARKTAGTGRLEAFSDGVFAIAITLLVLELSIEPAGTALESVLAAWPFFLAYIVSFLTIGAGWLAHSGITQRLIRVDAILLRLNLLLLLFVSLLPFPTRLVAEGLDDVSGERVFVTMYGLTLMAIRILLFAVDEYSNKERLYGARENGGKDVVRRTILPVAAAYVVAILVGLILPRLAVGLYCLLAIYLVIPFKEMSHLLLRRS